MTSNEIRRSFFDLTEKDMDEAETTALTHRWFGATSDWDEILKSRLILLVSEAQSGKTFECKARSAAMWKAGQPAFYVELASVAVQPWRELRRPEETERLDAWRQTESEIATVFLDAVDELRLTQGKFRTALRNVANDLGGQMARVRIVLTSRPLPVDRDLFLETFKAPPSRVELSEEDFATLALGEGTEKKDDGPPEVRYVSLLPIGKDDVAKLAAARGVRHIDAFLQALATSSMMEFMRRPQDVIEAVSTWKELKGKFGTHATQVECDIRMRLKPNIDRELGDGQLEDHRALEGAKRLALAVVLTQRLGIRHNVNRDIGDAVSAIDPSEILFDWRDDDRKALLERSLFGFASYGRVRFHNRLAFEFLAAQRLADLVDAGTSRGAVRRLLVVQTAQGLDVIRPSLQNVAGWLALRQAWLFDVVNELDPALLINLGDPGSLSVEQREKTLTTFIKRFGTGGWRGLSVPQIQIRRFAHGSLAPIVTKYFGAIENSEVRQILLGLIGYASLHDCAGIARSIVLDPKVDHEEKCNALDAMIALDDPELSSIAERIENGSDLWEQRFVRWAICRLFPQHISIIQLTTFLTRAEETKVTGSELSRMLPPRIAGMEKDQLEQLRSALTPLVDAGLTFDTNLHTSKNDRPHLIPLLAATCTMLLQADAFPPGLAESVVLAAELARGISFDKSVQSVLSEPLTLASAPIREAVFACDVAIQRRLRPDQPRLHLYLEGSWRDTLNFRSEDLIWIRKLAGNRTLSADLRAAALLIAMFALAPAARDRQVSLEDLRPLIADDEELASFLQEHLKPSALSRETRKLLLCNKWRENRKQRQREKHRAGWVNFWRQLKDDPRVAFSKDHAESTAWNLWDVMQRGGARSRSAGWDRQLIEQHLGKEVADRLREALLPLWRRESPPLESERPVDVRTTFYRRWALALAAITAEAEDPNWVSRLTTQEVETAVRYATQNTSGFPAWLDALAVAHPAIVECLLGGEISWTLSSPPGENPRSILLQNVYHAAPELARLFVPRLRSWLAAYGGGSGEIENVNSAAQRLDQVIEILLKFGAHSDRQLIRDLAAAAPVLESDDPLSRVWLPALFSVDPEAAVDRLALLCANVKVSRKSTAVAWVAELFGNMHRGHGAPWLKQPGMTATLLLRLVRLAYLHVDRTEDSVHEGHYSPDLRDDAETGRNMLLGALIDLEGHDGWTAKQEIADDATLAHLRDRIHTLAVEKSAREADNLTLLPREVIKFDAKKEPGPRSSGEMFALMSDRLDDLKDHLVGDTSPREMWAMIKHERLMRRAIAEHLEIHARDAYSVAQESPTAENKETDITLRSAITSLEGVIELKLGDKDYSVADLKAVVSEQLVGKYLAPTVRRAGILLITRAEREAWQHPETGATLDFAGVIAMLRTEATLVQDRCPNAIHIDVVGLDLAPRLATERKAKAGKRSASEGKKTASTPDQTSVE